MGTTRTFLSGYVLVRFMNGSKKLLCAASETEALQKTGAKPEEIAGYDDATRDDALQQLSAVAADLGLLPNETNVLNLLFEGGSVQDVEAMKGVRAITGCDNAESLDTINDRFKALDRLTQETGQSDSDSVTAAIAAIRAAAPWDGTTERRQVARTPEADQQTANATADPSTSEA